MPEPPAPAIASSGVSSSDLHDGSSASVGDLDLNVGDDLEIVPDVLTTPTPTRSPWIGRLEGLAAIIAIVIVAAPLLAAAWNLAHTAYRPAGDMAVIEMRVRDVGRQTPLVGPYSRYGWNHPGPLLYILLAIPYRILGSGSNTILAGSAVFNATVVLAIGVVVWRRGRLPLVALTAAVLMIFEYWMTPARLADPWNPYLTVLPVALFVLLAWSALERDRWALPASAFVGSFLVQSHIGYGPLVAAVGAAVVLASLVGWRRTRRQLREVVRSRWRWPVLLTGALVVLVWVPVLIDQLMGTGNLTSVADYFRSSDHPAYGFGQAVELLAREWGNRAPWLGGPEPVLAQGGAVGPRELGALGLPLLVTLAGAGAAAASRTWSALRLQALVGLAALVTMISVARITDVVYDYLVRWTWIIGMLIWLSALWSLWCGLVVLARRARRSLDERASTNATRDRTRPRPSLVALTTIAVVAGLVVLTNRAQATADRPLPAPEQWAYAPLEALEPQVLTATPADGTLLIRGEGGFRNSLTDGLALALERAGRRVAIASAETNKFGPHRTDEAPAPVATLGVIYAERIADWDRRPDFHAIARWDPLTADERDEFTSLTNDLRAQFIAGGREDLIHQLDIGDSIVGAYDIAGLDRVAADRWGELQRRGEPVAVYLGPPSS